jgi:hypothetical protein
MAGEDVTSSVFYSNTGLRAGCSNCSSCYKGAHEVSPSPFHVDAAGLGLMALKAFNKGEVVLVEEPFLTVRWKFSKVGLVDPT